MATTSQVVRNGQVIAAPTGEKELRIPGNVVRFGFLVTSGAMQVTTAARGSQDVISAAVAAFANTTSPVWMTMDNAGGSENSGTNPFIKGAGTILIFW